MAPSRCTWHRVRNRSAAAGRRGFLERGLPAAAKLLSTRCQVQQGARLQNQTLDSFLGGAAGSTPVLQQPQHTHLLPPPASSIASCLSCCTPHTYRCCWLHSCHCTGANGYGHTPYGAPGGAAAPAPAATTSIKLKDCPTPELLHSSHPLLLLLLVNILFHRGQWLWPYSLWSAWWCSCARTCGHHQHQAEGLPHA
jgi:hypothetical protein